VRLQRRAVARVARFLVDRFWAPVGSGVEADPEVEFLATYLFAGPDGLDAARKVDDTIRRLPGFETVQLLEAWMNGHVRGLEGRRQVETVTHYLAKYAGEIIEKKKAAMDPGCPLA
jgi:hypothetical protein